MNKYGNQKSKGNDSRNNGSGPQSQKVMPSSDKAGDTAEVNQKIGGAPTAHGEADSQQQKQTSAQFDESNQGAAADADKQPTPSGTGSTGFSKSIEEDIDDDEADELEAEKGRRHHEPSQEQKSDVGRRL